MTVERDKKGRMVFKANPEVFMKMANRMSEGWCAKAFARQTQEKYPVLFEERYKAEK